MLLVCFLQISGFFEPLNKITAPNNTLDPFLADENSSSEQAEFDATKDQSLQSDSSSTNKELFDDLADNKITNTLPPVPQSEDASMTQEKLEDFTKKFNDALQLDDVVKPITDKDMWKRLHDYIISHWDKFFIDGHLSVALELRYIMCSYVIAFIPGQFAFVIPGFYTYLIPKQVYKIPIISDALRGVKRFFKFCKKTSRDKLFLTFYFGRANSLKQDLEFLKRIPDMIKNNPVGIIRELLAFSIKADGYNPEDW